MTWGFVSDRGRERAPASCLNNSGGNLESGPRIPGGAGWRWTFRYLPSTDSADCYIADCIADRRWSGARCLRLCRCKLRSCLAVYSQQVTATESPAQGVDAPGRARQHGDCVRQSAMYALRSQRAPDGLIHVCGAWWRVLAGETGRWWRGWRMVACGGWCGDCR
jgi:hypothetical protein